MAVHDLAVKRGDHDLIRLSPVPLAWDEVGRLYKGSPTPEYRMRAGDYRVLFEVAGNRIFVYRILHRGEAYR